MYVAYMFVAWSIILVRAIIINATTTTTHYQVRVRVRVGRTVDYHMVAPNLLKVRQQAVVRRAPRPLKTTTTSTAILTKSVSECVCICVSICMWRVSMCV